MKSKIRLGKKIELIMIKLAFSKHIIRLVALNLSFYIIMPSMLWAINPTNFKAGANTVVFNDQIILVPKQYGTVEKKLINQSSKKLVIHIEDLHCHNEVQQNIAGLLSYLQKHHQLRLVGLEGTSQLVPATKLKTFPIKTIKKQVANYFVRQGQISGAELFAALSEEQVRLQGMEDQESYDQSYQLAMQFLTDETLGYLFDLREQFNELKDKVYSKTLLGFDQGARRFQAGHWSLYKYALYLQKQSQLAGIDISHFLLLKNYLKPTFGKEINQEQLYQDIDQLDELIRHQLYKNNQEKELDQQIKQLGQLEKLLSVSLTPQEWTTWSSAGNPLQELMTYLSKQGIKTELFLDAMPILKKQSQAAQRFYQLADERSHHLANNIINHMKTQHQSVAALITGGFHTNELQKSLQLQGINVITIQPRLTRNDLINPYFDILKKKQSPLEHLLAQNQKAIAVKPGFLKTELLYKIDVLLKALLAYEYRAELGKNVEQFKAKIQSELKSYVANNQTIQFDPTQVKILEARLLSLPFKINAKAFFVTIGEQVKALKARELMSIDKQHIVGFHDQEPELGHEQAHYLFMAVRWVTYAIISHQSALSQEVLTNTPGLFGLGFNINLLIALILLDLFITHYQKPIKEWAVVGGNYFRDKLARPIWRQEAPNVMQRQSSGRAGSSANRIDAPRWEGLPEETPFPEYEVSVELSIRAAVIFLIEEYLAAFKGPGRRGAIFGLPTFVKLLNRLEPDHDRDLDKDSEMELFKKYAIPLYRQLLTDGDHKIVTWTIRNSAPFFMGLMKADKTGQLGYEIGYPLCRQLADQQHPASDVMYNLLTANYGHADYYNAHRHAFSYFQVDPDIVDLVEKLEAGTMSLEEWNSFWNHFQEQESNIARAKQRQIENDDAAGKYGKHPQVASAANILKDPEFWFVSWMPKYLKNLTSPRMSVHTEAIQIIPDILNLMDKSWFENSPKVLSWIKSSGQGAKNDSMFFIRTVIEARMLLRQNVTANVVATTQTWQETTEWLKRLTGRQLSQAIEDNSQAFNQLLEQLREMLDQTHGLDASAVEYVYKLYFRTAVLPKRNKLPKNLLAHIIWDVERLRFGGLIGPEWGQSMRLTKEAFTYDRINNLISFVRHQPIEVIRALFNNISNSKARFRILKGLSYAGQRWPAIENLKLKEPVQELLVTYVSDPFAMDATEAIDDIIYQRMFSVFNLQVDNPRVDQLSEKELRVIRYLLTVSVNPDNPLNQELNPYFEARLKGSSESEAVQVFANQLEEVEGIKELLLANEIVDTISGRLIAPAPQEGEVKRHVRDESNKSFPLTKKVIIRQETSPIGRLHLGWPSLGGSCLDIESNNPDTAGYAAHPRVEVLYIENPDNQEKPLARVSVVFDPKHNTICLVSPIKSSQPYKYTPLLETYLKQWGQLLAERTGKPISILAPDLLYSEHVFGKEFKKVEKEPLTINTGPWKFYSDLVTVDPNENKEVEIKGWKVVIHPDQPNSDLETSNSQAVSDTKSKDKNKSNTGSTNLRRNILSTLLMMPLSAFGETIVLTEVEWFSGVAVIAAVIFTTLWLVSWLVNKIISLTSRSKSKEVVKKKASIENVLNNILEDYEARTNDDELIELYAAYFISQELFSSEKQYQLYLALLQKEDSLEFLTFKKQAIVEAAQRLVANTDYTDHSIRKVEELIESAIKSVKLQHKSLPELLNIAKVANKKGLFDFKQMVYGWHTNPEMEFGYNQLSAWEQYFINKQIFYKDPNGLVSFQTESDLIQHQPVYRERLLFGMLILSTAIINLLTATIPSLLTIIMPIIAYVYVAYTWSQYGIFLNPLPTNIAIIKKSSFGLGRGYALLSGFIDFYLWLFHATRSFWIFLQRIGHKILSRFKIGAYWKVANNFIKEIAVVGEFIHQHIHPDKAVSILGGTKIEVDTDKYKFVKDLGRKLVAAGYQVVVGGTRGAMSAALSGAKQQQLQQEALGEKLENVAIHITSRLDVPRNPHASFQQITRFFSLHKTALLKPARATIITPGGIGTLDELVEAIFDDIPLVLVDSAYWMPIMGKIEESLGTNHIWKLEKFKDKYKITDDADVAIEYINSQPNKRTFDIKTLMPKLISEAKIGLAKMAFWEPAVVFMGGAKTAGTLNRSIMSNAAQWLDKQGAAVRVADHGVYGLFQGLGLNKLQVILMTTNGDKQLDGDHPDFMIHAHEPVYRELFNIKARALVIGPGHEGKLNLFLHALVQYQTGNRKPKKIILVGSEYWNAVSKAVFDAPHNHSPPLVRDIDRELFVVVDTEAELQEQLKQALKETSMITLVKKAITNWFKKIGQWRPSMKLKKRALFIVLLLSAFSVFGQDPVGFKAVIALSDIITIEFLLNYLLIGLPVIAIVVGLLFLIINRLDPGRKIKTDQTLLDKSKDSIKNHKQAVSDKEIINLLAAHFASLGFIDNNDQEAVAFRLLTESDGLDFLTFKTEAIIKAARTLADNDETKSLLQAKAREHIKAFKEQYRQIPVIVNQWKQSRLSPLINAKQFIAGYCVKQEITISASQQRAWVSYLREQKQSTSVIDNYASFSTINDHEQKGRKVERRAQLSLGLLLLTVMGGLLFGAELKDFYLLAIILPIFVMVLVFLHANSEQAIWYGQINQWHRFIIDNFSFWLGYVAAFVNNLFTPVQIQSTVQQNELLPEVFLHDLKFDDTELKRGLFNTVRPIDYNGLKCAMALSRFYEKNEQISDSERSDLEERWEIRTKEDAHQHLERKIKNGRNFVDLTYKGHNIAPELYAVVKDQDGRIIGYLMEWVGGEELGELVRLGKISGTDFEAIIEQVNEQQEILSAKNLVHGDLASRNILVNKRGIYWVVRLVDFGINKPQEKNTKEKVDPHLWSNQQFNLSSAHVVAKLMLICKDVYDQAEAHEKEDLESLQRKLITISQQYLQGNITPMDKFVLELISKKTLRRENQDIDLLLFSNKQFQYEYNIYIHPELDKLVPLSGIMTAMPTFEGRRFLENDHIQTFIEMKSPREIILGAITDVTLKIESETAGLGGMMGWLKEEHVDWRMERFLNRNQEVAQEVIAAKRLQFERQYQWLGAAALEMVPIGISALASFGALLIAFYTGYLDTSTTTDYLLRSAHAMAWASFPLLHLVPKTKDNRQALKNRHFKRAYQNFSYKDVINTAIAIVIAVIMMELSFSSLSLGELVVTGFIIHQAVNLIIFLVQTLLSKNTYHQARKFINLMNRAIVTLMGLPTKLIDYLKSIWSDSTLTPVEVRTDQARKQDDEQKERLKTFALAALLILALILLAYWIPIGNPLAGENNVLGWMEIELKKRNLAESLVMTVFFGRVSTNSFQNLFGDREFLSEKDGLYQHHSQLQISSEPKNNRINLYGQSISSTAWLPLQIIRWPRVVYLFVLWNLFNSLNLVNRGPKLQVDKIKSGQLIYKMKRRYFPANDEDAATFRSSQIRSMNYTGRGFEAFLGQYIENDKLNRTSVNIHPALLAAAAPSYEPNGLTSFQRKLSHEIMRNIIHYRSAHYYEQTLSQQWLGMVDLVRWYLNYRRYKQILESKASNSNSIIWLIASEVIKSPTQKNQATLLKLVIEWMEQKHSTQELTNELTSLSQLLNSLPGKKIKLGEIRQEGSKLMSPQIITINIPSQLHKQHGFLIRRFKSLLRRLPVDHFYYQELRPIKKRRQLWNLPQQAA